MDKYFDILDLSFSQEPFQIVKSNDSPSETRPLYQNETFEESLEKSVEELHQQLRIKLLVD